MNLTEDEKRRQLAQLRRTDGQVAASRRPIDSEVSRAVDADARAEQAVDLAAVFRRYGGMRGA